MNAAELTQVDVAPPLPGDPPRNTAIAPSDDPRNRSAWVGWPLLLIVVLGLVIARLVWMRWFVTPSIAIDEAERWDWSRYAALSYPTMGPAFAWLMRLSTACLGDTAVAVRAPAAVCHGLMVLVVARLTASISTGDARDRSRAACYGGLAALAIAAFTIAGMRMLPEVPFLLCWALGAWFGWLCLSQRAAGRSMYGSAIGLGLAIGFGLHFKLAIVLLVLGIVGCWWCLRSKLPASGRLAGRRAAALAALVALVCAMPIIIWQSTNGWPAFQGLPAPLEQFALTSALTNIAQRYELAWTAKFLLNQLIATGPMAALIVLVLCRSSGSRKRRGQRLPPPAAQHAVSPLSSRDAKAYLVWCAAPVWIVGLAMTGLGKPAGIEPIAAYVTLAALVGCQLSPAFPALRARIRAWEALFPPRPRSNWLRKKPISAITMLWQVCFVWGGLMIAASFLSLERPKQPTPGGAALAAQVQDWRAALEATTGQPVMVVAADAGHASLLAFYLDNQPVVRCGSSLLGHGASAYDHFDATRWDRTDDPRISGPAVLVGEPLARWQETLVLEGATQMLIMDRGLPEDEQAIPLVLVERYMGVTNR